MFKGQTIRIDWEVKEDNAAMTSFVVDDVTVHFVKDNVVLSKDSRSSDQLMHDIKVALARNYVRNLSEEVRKGLRE